MTNAFGTFFFLRYFTVPFLTSCCLCHFTPPGQMSICLHILKIFDQNHFRNNAEIYYIFAFKQGFPNPV